VAITMHCNLKAARGLVSHFLLTRPIMHRAYRILLLRRRAIHSLLKLRRPRKVWSRSTYPLSSYSVSTSDALHYVV